MRFEGTAGAAAPVIVTGGCGFIGLNVIETLGEAGHAVVAIDPNDPPTEATDRPWSAGVTWVRGGLDRVAEYGRPGSAVVHLAATTAGPQRERADAAGIVALNVTGTQAMLDGARSSGASRIVAVSTGAVYGSRSIGSEPIDEETPPDPNSLYGITKLAAEHLALRHGVLWDTPVVVPRLGPVFGPWEHPSGVRDTLSPFLALAERAMQGGHARVPRTAPRQWTYARDVGAALAALATGSPVPLDRYLHDRYLVVSPRPITLEAWAQRLSTAFDGFTYDLVDGPGDVPYDGDPAAPRSPVVSDRMQDLLPGWSRPADAAMDDYVGWLSERPTTSASSATTP